MGKELVDKVRRDQIIIEDWTGRLLYKGSYKLPEVDNVLNVNRCSCDDGCKACDDSGYIGDFEVYWAYPELNQDRNVYEYINY